MKTHSILARLVFVLHGHRLCCEKAVVLIASIDIRTSKSVLCTFDRETGDPQHLKYGVFRIIGSGATVHSVSRCLLMVKTSILLFRDGMEKLERWNNLMTSSGLIFFDEVTERP